MREEKELFLFFLFFQKKKKRFVSQIVFLVNIVMNNLFIQNFFLFKMFKGGISNLLLFFQEQN